jgi:hypothetical protein
MSLYYQGDLKSDLDELAKTEDASVLLQLDQIGKSIGYGRSQQILQILWAKHLNELGYSTTGALGR